MSRCLPFPPPGYENGMKSSNGELGNLYKKKKHEDKKEKKEKSKDEDKLHHMETKKKDKKHTHHKHKKDKNKDMDGEQNREKNAITDRHGGHEFDKKRVGDAQDSPKKGEAVKIIFFEPERPCNGNCNKIDLSDTEVTRQTKDKTRDNGIGGDQKIDKDRVKSNGNMRKRKEIITQSFLHFGDVEDSPKKREAVSIKFVGRDRLGNRKCDNFDLSDREGSRQDNCKTRDNGMEEDQKTEKDMGKSNGKVRKSKEIDTNSSLHVGDAQESTKKREAVSIKFVERERLGNGKCHKINLSDIEGSRPNKDDTRDNSMKEDWKFDKTNDIVRKRKEIDSNSSSHGNRLWIHLPVLTDEDKQYDMCLRTAFAEKVHSDIGRTAYEAIEGVKCMPTISIDKERNDALGKCVNSTSFLPSFSGKDKHSKNSLPTAFAKKFESDTRRMVQEVKNAPVECIPNARVQGASNAALEKCVASTSCHPSFSAKYLQSNKRTQAAFAKDAKDCAVECIPESSVKKVSKVSLEKRVASTSCHLSFSGKDKWSNKRPRTTSVEDFHSDIWRNVQEEKDGAVEFLTENRVQKAGNAAHERCVAGTSCHPSLSGKDKRSHKHPRTAFAEELLSDIGRTVQEENDGAVECKPGSRVHEASNFALKRRVSDTNCHPSLSGKDKQSNKHPGTAFAEELLSDFGRKVQEANDGSVECKPGKRVHEASNATLQKCVTRTCCVPSFPGKDCERNGVVDCKTSLHFVGPSHSNTEAVDDVPSGTRTDKHILDLKYLHSVPPRQGWSDVDDQAWLFLSNNRKPKAAVKFNLESNVWDQALFLQPNNIYALPYVTPF